MHKLTFSLLTALVFLLATGAPSFAQESTGRPAPVGTRVESGQAQLLAVLRPLLADGRVIVTMMPERTDWLKALPEQPVSPDQLAAAGTLLPQMRLDYACRQCHNGDLGIGPNLPDSTLLAAAQGYHEPEPEDLTGEQ